MDALGDSVQLSQTQAAAHHEQISRIVISPSAVCDRVALVQCSVAVLEHVDPVLQIQDRQLYHHDDVSMYELVFHIPCSHELVVRTPSESDCSASVNFWFPY